MTEDYTEEQSIAHIRRLLDIVACTTSFGSAKPAGRTSPKDSGSKDAGSTEAVQSPGFDDGTDQNKTQKTAENKKKAANVTNNKSAAKSECTEGVAEMCPPPRLGQFYDFFSFSHLTPPVQCEFCNDV